MNKGISLLSLIITIIVTIILASLTVFSSLETIRDANLTKRRNEFTEVCTFVREISTKVEADLLDIELSGETLATAEQLSNVYVVGMDDELSSDDVNKINSINDAVRAGRNPKFGYHYITGEQLEYGIPGIENVTYTLEDVKNDYIINFNYGVIITKISDTEVERSGNIR